MLKEVLKKDTDQEKDKDIIWVSKSEMKRDAESLKYFGAELVSIGTKMLDKLPLDDDLRSAVEFAKGIKKEGRRRQLQLIGKMLRKNYELELIKTALHKLKKQNKQDNPIVHKLEHIRDSLINEGDSAIASALLIYPQLDRQKMRTLIRNFKKEKTTNKISKSSRQIFQYLCQLSEDK
ncbi:ribosome biogenesis factor YjgA [Candidatus Profftia tarda]|nr:ribosome biogenesis factor YjgA [Candidatus Profftia tarda]